MAISKKQIERIAKEVVDESYEDIGKESDKNNSKMYLGLVIGITRFMNKLKEQD